MKQRVPARDGWFTMDAERPQLIGLKCADCGVYVFPGLGVGSCPSPSCVSAELERVPLSRVGRIWSYTSASYKPPPPFIATEPFEPFVIAAVELEHERLVVLGQIAAGVENDAVKVGTRVELVLEVLFEDEEAQHMIWKWKPVSDAQEVSHG